MSLLANPDGTLAVNASGNLIVAPSQAVFEECCCIEEADHACGHCDFTPKRFTAVISGVTCCFEGVEWICDYINDTHVLLQQSSHNYCSWEKREEDLHPRVRYVTVEFYYLGGWHLKVRFFWYYPYGPESVVMFHATGEYDCEGGIGLNSTSCEVTYVYSGVGTVVRGP